jgi:hypothetical protein
MRRESVERGSPFIIMKVKMLNLGTNSLMGTKIRIIMKKS